MKRLKKMLIGLLVLCIAISIIGCGGTSSNTEKAATNNDEKTSESNEKAVEKSGEAVEIRLASWRVEEIEAFKKLNEEFSKEFPNIKVKYESVKATEYDSILATSFATNTAADLAYIRPFDRGVNLFEAGNIIELSEKELPNLKNISDTQKKVYQDKDGKLFALPYIYVSYGFIYNKAIFDKSGLSEPDTWDDFYKALDTLKKNNVTPLALGTKDAWVLSEVVSNGNYATFVGGEDWRQALLKGEKNFMDTNFVSFIQNILKWKEYMPKDFQAIGYTEAQQMFLTEQAAIFPAGSWEIGYFASQNPELKMGVFTSPAVNKSDKKWLGFNGGAGIGVNKQTKHLKEALTYANWLGGEKAQIMSGNLMAGLYPCANVPADKIENPLAKKWIEFAGAKGENFSVGWALEKISKQEPSASVLAQEGITKLFNGEFTPEQAAEHIQKGVSSWYEPLKK